MTSTQIPADSLLSRGASVLRLAELPRLPDVVEPERSSIPQLMAHLLSAQCGEQRQAIVSSAVRSLGFEGLVYQRINVCSGEPVCTSMCVSDDDLEWVHLYCEHRYEVCDPRLRLVLSSPLSCHWTVGELRQSAGDNSNGEAVHAFLNAMENNGVRSGIMTGVPGPRTGERSIIDLFSTKDEHRINDDSLMANTLMLAICLHEFCSIYLQWPVRANQELARLSATQIQILRGLARGLSDRELAADLRLSKHGVDYHLRQLRRHFSARNRVELIQAVLRADGFGPVD